MARLRLYQPDDAAHLAGIFVEAVRGIGPSDYSPEQVQAWAAGASADRFAARAGDGRVVWVALDVADQPCAFIDLEADGHIDFLYCRPAEAGTGTAAALYAVLESHARKTGLTRLYTEASEAARRFFLKRGFVVTQRRDFPVRGVMIHNYAMEKRLS